MKKLESPLGAHTVREQSESTENIDDVEAALKHIEAKSATLEAEIEQKEEGILRSSDLPPDTLTDLLERSGLLAKLQGGERSSSIGQRSFYGEGCTVLKHYDYGRRNPLI